MVIQRWQSVLLLIAAVMMGLFSFCFLGQIQYFNDSVNITTLGLQYEGEPTAGGQSGYLLSTVYIFVISLVSMTIPFIAIFCFKNLRLQKRLCLLTCLLIMATCLSEALTVYYSGITAQEAPGWSSIVAAPFIALIAVLTAWRCINSDKKKLEGYDRLR